MEKLQLQRDAETSSRMVLGAEDFSSRGLVGPNNLFNNWIIETPVHY